MPSTTDGNSRGSQFVGMFRAVTQRWGLRLHRRGLLFEARGRFGFRSIAHYLRLQRARYIAVATEICHAPVQGRCLHDMGSGAGTGLAGFFQVWRCWEVCFAKFVAIFETVG